MEQYPNHHEDEYEPLFLEVDGREVDEMTITWWYEPNERYHVIDIVDKKHDRYTRIDVPLAADPEEVYKHPFAPIQLRRSVELEKPKDE